MKFNLVNAFFIFITFSSTAQISLKGVTLGEKHFFDTTTTTVGGLEGELWIDKTADDICYKITFLTFPSYDNLDSYTFPSFEDIKTVVKGFKENYNLYVPDGISENGINTININSINEVVGHFSQDIDGVNYFISVMEASKLANSMYPDGSNNTTFVLSIVLTDIVIDKKLKEILQNQKLNDF